MAERLARIAQTARLENGHNNQPLIDRLRADLDRSAGHPQRAILHQQLAYQLLVVGKVDEAIDQYRMGQEALAQADRPEARTAREKLHRDVGIAYLRMGEQENCVAAHTVDSCLAPIRPGSFGVHRNRRGSSSAVTAFLAALQAEPDDAESRWLLNIACMTLGEYPEGVPTRWRVSPSAFESEATLPRFYNIAPNLNLDVVGLAGGVVVEDFDRDEYLDIMVSSMGLNDPLRVFHNERDGSFADWSERSGLSGIVGGLNLCHADYDNDGDTDILVLRGAWLKAEGRIPNSLLRNNGDGTFVDVTESAGMLSARPTQTAAWADFDGDGWLDVFIGNESWPPERVPCELYHNNRDGTFTECAGRLGLAVEGIVKGVAWGDINNDGRPDLYISRFGAENLLFRNDGPAHRLNSSNRQIRQRTGPPGWSFTEVGERAGIREPVWSFPCWFWDFDNDGWEDLAAFNLRLDNAAADYLGLPHSKEYAPRIYRNRRDGTFEDVTAAVGLDRVMPTMGCNYGDLNNDGFLDFYLGTGDPDLSTLVPNRMFVSDQGKRFLDVTTAGGFGHLQKGHGVAFADLDNDGDEDVYAVMGGFFVADVAHNVLFENPGNDNRWIALRLEGRSSNRAAIGARVRVDVAIDAERRSIYRTVGTGGSFGATTTRLHIGLGRASAVEAVTVTWPTTGRSDVYERVPLGCLAVIREDDRRLVIRRLSAVAFSPSRGREPPPSITTPAGASP
jgi:hypothetical protein